MQTCSAFEREQSGSTSRPCCMLPWRQSPGCACLGRLAFGGSSLTDSARSREADQQSQEDDGAEVAEALHGGGLDADCWMLGPSAFPHLTGSAAPWLRLVCAALRAALYWWMACKHCRPSAFSLFLSGLVVELLRGRREREHHLSV